jgi:hypothetical protein
MRTHPTRILSVLALVSALAGLGCTTSGGGGGGSLDGGAGTSDAGAKPFNPGILPKMNIGGGLLPGIGSAGKPDAGTGPVGPGPGPVGPGPGPTTGTATCAQIVDCLGSCGASDVACLNACRAKGSPSAQAAFGALLSCAQSCTDTACVQSQCGPQVQACVSNGTVGPGPSPDAGPGPTTGASTCLQILDCLDTCADGDNTCPNACRAKGSAAAQTTFNTLLACAQTCADTACIQSKCGQQLQACVAPAGPGPGPGLDAGPGPGPGPTTGTSTCAQIVACLDTCTDGDSACYTACEAKGTASAQATFGALLTCAQSCPTTGCATGQCATQVQACKDDGATGPGPGPGPTPPAGTSCGDILDCLDLCADSDTACANACRAKGTAAAQAAFNTLLACAQTCADPTCIENQCAAQLQACVNTGTTPPVVPGPGPGSVPAPPTKKRLTRMLTPIEPYRLMLDARAGR